MENKMRMMTLYYILKTFIRSTRNLGMVTVILGEKLSSSIRYLRKCIRMIKIWEKKPIRFRECSGIGHIQDD